MSLLFALVSLAAVGGEDAPDLAAVDKAVTSCDAKQLARIFAAEPKRRRSFAIAAFEEEKAIVEARRTLANQRLAALSPGEAAIGSASTAQPQTKALLSDASPADLDRQGQLIAARQQALDDALRLSRMRDDTLDLMRRQYLTQCAPGKIDAAS